MGKKFKIKPVYKTLALLLAVLVVLVGLLAGCGTRGAVARGWAGGVISGNTLYVGSMTGDIIPVNLASGNISDPIPVEETQTSSGFLSCAAGSSAVVMYGSPAVDGDIIYVGGYNTGKVYAISASTRLSTNVYLQVNADTSAKNIVGGPVVYNGKVFIGSTDGYVYALNTVSLKPAWSAPFETGDKIWSTPAVVNDTVYIGSFDKKMYALNTADGSLKWDYLTEGAIVSTPLVDSGTVYFGSFDRNMYALNAETGALKWKYKADNWFWAKPVVYGNKLYAPCLDGKVYVLDAATGQKVGEYDLENSISSSPVIIDGKLVIAAQSDTKGQIQNSMLYVIDLATGTKDPIDIFETGESVYANLIAGDGKVFVQSTLNNVYEVDIASGASKLLVADSASAK